VIKAGLAALVLVTVGGPLEQRSQALECPSCVTQSNSSPFRGGPFVPLNGEINGGHTLSPAICGTPNNGFIIISANNKGQYINFEFNASFRGQQWDTWDSGVTFKSKPTCAVVDQANNSNFTQPNFVVVGLGNDGHLHSAGGEYSPVGYPQGNGVPISKIDTRLPVDEVVDAKTTYTAGPGLASVLFTSTSGIALTIAVDSNNVIWAYSKAAPYFYSKWSAPQKVGIVPQGWTPYGAPALANEAPNFNTSWVIAMNLQNTSTKQNSMWLDTFATDVNGKVTQTGNLIQMTGSLSGITINDAPALDWDPQLGVATVFFRSGNQMVQTSGIPLFNFGGYPVEPAQPPAPDWPSSFSPVPSSPGAAYGHYDQGFHVVVARGSDGHIYEAESTFEYNLTP
jgi:hypothetical protein